MFKPSGLDSYWIKDSKTVFITVDIIADEANWFPQIKKTDKKLVMDRPCLGHSELDSHGIKDSKTGFHMVRRWLG